MKKLFVSLFVVIASTSGLMADVYNGAESLPCVLPTQGWKRIPDVAQYKQADWSNVIGRVENVSVDEAKAIANSDPNITFFFWVKGGRMILEDLRNPSDPIYRIFYHGDAVFFTGEPWWGSAPDLADGYIKE